MCTKLCQNTTTPKNAVSANEAAAATPDKYRFEIARDTRGREVTGLWVRNGRYYVQANIPGKGSRRFALLDAEHQPVKTLQEAQDAAMEFGKAKRDGELPDSRRAPLFSDYVDHYIKWLEETEAKSQLTINKESGALKGWKKHLGGIRLTQITRRMINDYVQERKKAGRNNRTANLDVIALGNLLKFAKDEGYLKAVITEDSKPLQ